jgi:hypothetical protein
MLPVTNSMVILHLSCMYRKSPCEDDIGFVVEFRASAPNFLRRLFLLNEARVSQPGKAAPSFFLFLDVLSDVR